MRLQNEAQLQQFLKRGNAKLPGKLPTTKKKPRVNSKKTIIDGIEFDSIAEGNIYHEFKLDPKIELIELHPYYLLIEPFKRRGKTYRKISFTADFKVKKDGKIWVVDVKSKGSMKANSKSYPMRRKLFLWKYPELRFMEIIFDGKKRVEKFY